MFMKPVAHKAEAHRGGGWNELLWGSVERNSGSVANYDGFSRQLAVSHLARHTQGSPEAMGPVQMREGFACSIKMSLWWRTRDEGNFT